MHIHIHKHSVCVYICIYIHIYIHTYTYTHTYSVIIVTCDKAENVCIPYALSLCVRMHAYTHTCIMYLFVRVHVHMSGNRFESIADVFISFRATLIAYARATMCVDIVRNKRSCSSRQHKYQCICIWAHISYYIILCYCIYAVSKRLQQQYSSCSDEAQFF